MKVGKVNGSFYILQPTVTLSNKRNASSYLQKITGRCGSATTTGITRYALSVTVTSGFYTTGNQQLSLSFKTTRKMVTIEINDKGERFIHCSMRGGSAEYVEYLRALAIALSSTHDDLRPALSQVLVEMLPTENQVKIDTQ
jgi:hypothetical protein